MLKERIRHRCGDLDTKFDKKSGISKCFAAFLLFYFGFGVSSVCFFSVWFSWCPDLLFSSSLSIRTWRASFLKSILYILPGHKVIMFLRFFICMICLIGRLSVLFLLHTLVSQNSFSNPETFFVRVWVFVFFEKLFERFFFPGSI